jgi:hypothetical protein
MNRAGKTVAVVALILGVSFVADTGAQSSGGQYNISSVAIAGGGSPIAGGNYQITSTLGQPATTTLSGGSYVVFDGFWSPVDGADDFIFANGFETN